MTGLVSAALLVVGSIDTPSTAADEETCMQIAITVNGQRFGATLTESAAARDLIAQLPVTVEMTDHGGVEKTGPLPAPLSFDGQPEGDAAEQIARLHGPVTVTVEAR